MFKLKKLSKQERSWVLYDVANSAFVLTVITVLFPILYGSMTNDGDYESNIFKLLVSGIALLVAIISPMLGALADYRGNKKKFFRIFLITGLIGGLALAIPGLNWIALLVIFAIASIGFNATNIFYDAFLIDVTEEEKMDEISALGFAMGYIGSLIPFFIGILPFALIKLEIVENKIMFGTTTEHLTISFAFIVSIVWWLLYSLPLLKDVKQRHYLEHEEKPVRKALKRLSTTFTEIRKYKNILLFMLAFLFYIDVVNGVIRLAVNLGKDLGISDTMLLGVVVLIQFIAFPFAILYGNLTKKFGGKRMLLFGIFIYFLIVVTAAQITDGREWLIWIVALLVGSAQGGIQAVSRSYFARMVPIEKANEFFGFFGVFSRFAGVFSPFIIAMLSFRYTNNIAVYGFLIPLTIGFILMLFVPDIDKKEAV